MSLVKRFEAAARQRDAYWLEETRLLAAQRDDLLEALKVMVASAHPNPTEHPAMTRAWAQARAAIAKAVGEPVAPG